MLPPPIPARQLLRRLRFTASLTGEPFTYYDGAVANPTGGGATWTYAADTVPDSQLEVQLIAPLAHLNDPPPGASGSTVKTGGTIMAWWQGRIWMASSNFVFFDAGPDCLNGIPEEAWPPANVFGFPGAVTGLAPTSQGLVVAVSDQFFVILGGPQTLTFYSQPLLQNFGLSSPNCMTQDGDTIYLLNTAGQYFSLSATGKSEDGWRVGDLLQTNFSPTGSYVTMHRAGEDTGVFLSNSAPMASIETSPGIYTLVLASPFTTAGEKFIMARSLTTFSDEEAIPGNFILRYGLNSSAWSPLYQTSAGAYPAFLTMGSITLSMPGTATVPLWHVLTSFVNVGTKPTVSVLFNEIAAGGTQASSNFINLPQSIDMMQSEHINTSRSLLYLKWPANANQVRQPLLAHNVQVKITFSPTDTVKNELLYLGLKFDND